MRMAAHDGLLARGPGKCFEVGLGNRAQASPGLNTKWCDLVTTFGGGTGRSSRRRLSVLWLRPRQSLC